ncbi:MAG: SDR family oxidoreductase [candidate division NC10 bacterium]|nr:SDR family oxidoreductase [candidate division NC10 bacterium]
MHSHLGPSRSLFTHRSGTRKELSRLSTTGATCVEGEVEDLSAVARACDGCEVVFHVAGLVHFREDWDLFRRVNVNGTRQVLQAARSAGVRRLVHTSSIVAVGASTRPEVLDEDARWDLDRLAVPYVTTKRVAEDVALEAARGGLDVVVVNPASVVGPGDLSRSLFGTWCHRFWRGNIPFYFWCGPEADR